MGVANELHREVLTHLHHVSRTNGLEGGAVGDTSLIHFSSEHGQGQTRPINHWDIEVLEMVCNSTDVIFMTMGHDHAANPTLVFTQEAGVGHHYIHPVHPVTGECQTGIHKHQIVAVLEHAGVLADLMQATQWNHSETGLLGFRKSGCHQ